MKKFMLPAIVAIAAASGIIGFSNQSSKHELNALAIANIEALSIYELPPLPVNCSNSGSGDCYEISLNSKPCPAGSPYITSIECDFSGSMGDYCEPFSC